MDNCSEQNICSPQNCRNACAQEVIDALLCEHGSVRGEEVDLLLDLRWLLRHREQPEAVLHLFCELRRCLEEKHYLLFYRLRRWLENHLQAVAQTAEGKSEVPVPLKLDFYCLEALRAACVRAVRQHQPALNIRFAFRVQEPSLAVLSP